MSYIPASKMPHPHAAPQREEAIETPAEQRAFKVPTFAWAGAAAIAGVGAVAALLSLRSSAPKQRAPRRRKAATA